MTVELKYWKKRVRKGPLGVGADGRNPVCSLLIHTAPQCVELA